MSENNSSFLKYLADNLPEEQRWMIFDKIKIQTRFEIYSDLIRYEQNVLSQMRKKHGADSEVFRFFDRIKNTIIQAAEQQYIIEQQKDEVNFMKQEREFYMAQNLKMQRKLERYETIEEMTVEGVLQHHVDQIQKMLKDRQINDKTKAATLDGKP